MTEPLAWVHAVLAGMATPAVIALVLAATTLLLEDVAIAAGVALATQGAISWEFSVAAVAAGIAIGDLLLYAAGRGTLTWSAVRRRVSRDAVQRVRTRLLHGLPSAIFLARAIPGLRLTTYVACGALKVPQGRFFAWVLLAVTIWTLGLYALSASLGMAISDRFGVPAPVAVALPMVAVALAVPLIRIAADSFTRKPA